ncbi:MAG: hypothetical protein IM600_18380 [Bacteroidetes bacterium]|nr:hypothetical protein [Bacteroidota bacterium]MCA6445400.1 hypothetical protein [Bacteroidota bacterium]
MKAVILFIPFIPLLALLAIGGGIATLIWYSNLSPKQQDEADRLALNAFGKKFKELSEEQQKKIKKNLS